MEKDGQVIYWRKMPKDNQMNATLCEIETKIIENKEQIKLLLGETPLFGAVGGSVSINLSNKSSDVDFYLITKNSPQQIIKTVILPEQYNLKVDFMCVSAPEVIEECQKYYTVPHDYPTRFYRKKCENEKIMKQKDYERSSFKREIVMRIFMAQHIIEFQNNSVKNYYMKMKKGLILLDIWDSYFERAYGNYYEYIKGHNNVLIRKYLYTIHEIFICHFLIESAEQLTINFQQMFTLPYSQYLNEIYGLCETLWEKNKNASLSKEKLLTENNVIVDEWIERKLEEIQNEMNLRKSLLKNSYFMLHSNKIVY